MLIVSGVTEYIRNALQRLQNEDFAQYPSTTMKIVSNLPFRFTISFLSATANVTGSISFAFVTSIAMSIQGK